MNPVLTALSLATGPILLIGLLMSLRFRAWHRGLLSAEPSRARIGAHLALLITLEALLHYGCWNLYQALYEVYAGSLHQGWGSMRGFTVLYFTVGTVIIGRVALQGTIRYAAGNPPYHGLTKQGQDDFE